MIRFLRLFRPYRELELALQKERDAKARAESERSRMQAVAIKAKAEITFWRDRCVAAESKVDDLNAKLLEDSRRIADTMSVHAIGKRIYSKADPIPVDWKPHSAPLGSGRIFGRAEVAKQTAQTAAQLDELLKAATQ